MASSALGFTKLCFKMENVKVRWCHCQATCLFLKVQECKVNIIKCIFGVLFREKINLKRGKTIEYENMETDTGRFTGWDPYFYRSSIFSCRRWTAGTDDHKRRCFSEPADQHFRAQPQVDHLLLCESGGRSCTCILFAAGQETAKSYPGSLAALQRITGDVHTGHWKFWPVSAYDESRRPSGLRKTMS